MIKNYVHISRKSMEIAFDVSDQETLIAFATS